MASPPPKPSSGLIPLLTTAETPSLEAQEIDPVCGMRVDPKSAAGSAVHKGHTYYFCAPQCLQKFKADPDRYLALPHPSALTPHSLPLSPSGIVEYVCPMDPEIVSDHPGSCPKCGMALEPRTVSLEEGPDPELVSMQRRFWIALALSLPVFLLHLASFLPLGAHWL